MINEKLDEIDSGHENLTININDRKVWSGMNIWIWGKRDRLYLEVPEMVPSLDELCSGL